jgi:predicted nucleic acid-binding protein
MHTSSTICVDASCIVRLLADPDDREIQRRWTEWQSDRRSLVAPRILRYEVTNALYRYQRSGQRSDMTIRSALRTAMDLPITLYDEMDLHDRAMDWAIRLSLPATDDAHYLALANRLGAELWTEDRRLVDAARREVTWVYLIEP